MNGMLRMLVATLYLGVCCGGSCRVSYSSGHHHDCDSHHHHGSGEHCHETHEPGQTTPQGLAIVEFGAWRPAHEPLAHPVAGIEGIEGIALEPALLDSTGELVAFTRAVLAANPRWLGLPEWAAPLEPFGVRDTPSGFEVDWVQDSPRGGWTRFRLDADGRLVAVENRTWLVP